MNNKTDVKSCLSCKLWDICHTRMSIDKFKDTTFQTGRSQFQNAPNVVSKIYCVIGDKCKYFEMSKEPLELY